jgi:hypothetical protein
MERLREYWVEQLVLAKFNTLALHIYSQRRKR